MQIPLRHYQYTSLVDFANPLTTLSWGQHGLQKQCRQLCSIVNIYRLSTIKTILKPSKLQQNSLE